MSEDRGERKGHTELVDSPGDLEAGRRAGEPPVVARLVVEIRSDGSRTIARGAVEDFEAGQRVAVEAKGDTPLQLAFALARSLFQAPTIARSAARALLPGRRRRGEKKP